MDLSILAWRKSSYSADNQGDCIELANASSIVAVRDSKDPEGPKLLLDRGDFRRFASTVKNLQA
ncbi:DUF397 domain-containing protein [Actinomadura hibisca]|uniref:DUF397 domain-containing protein n=1 Tax=Actinomadura hibisca TaxID=68565 RepID=UPI00082DD1F3|nr:DUF397 domain-containing protein [Actinomadura hibisca]